MGDFLELLWRELALLAFLFALGSGLTVPLRGSVPLVARIALAPALGLATAACLGMTLTYVIPGDMLIWAVNLPLAIVSLVVAVRMRGEGERFESPLRDLGQLAIVGGVIVTAFNLMLAKRGSLGPVGYQIADAFGYESTTVGLSGHAQNEANWGAVWDITGAYGYGFVKGFQQLGLESVFGPVDALLGLNAVNSLSAFIIAEIVVGGLAAFGVMRALVPRPTWPAVLAGVLFAGPVFYQLFIDGSLAALSGLGLIVPIGFFAWRLITRAKTSDAVLLGILAGGIQTLYPLFVPQVAVAGALVALYLLGARLLRGGFRWHELLRPATLIFTVLLVAVLATPVAFSRNADYWVKIATTDYLKMVNAVLPVYNLPLPVIPSWLFGTREFYFLTTSTEASLQQWLLGDVIPLVLVVLVVFAAVRQRWLLPLLAVVLVAGVLAYTAKKSDNCSYCVQRNLLVVAPILAVAVSAGVASLWLSRRPWGRTVAVLIAAVLVVLVGHKSSVMARRGMDGAYMATAAARTIAGDLSGRKGPILLEGIGSSGEAVFEQPHLYNMVNEATDQRLSLNTEGDDYRGMLYLGGAHPRGPQYTPAYRWVYTRIPAVKTARRTVARDGTFALEKRTDPLDVTPITGILSEISRRNHDGIAYVVGPLTFWLSDLEPGPASLRVTLAGPGAGAIKKPKRWAALDRSPRTLVLCADIATGPQLRRVTLPIAYTPPPPKAVAETFALRPAPGDGVKLAAMRATREPCERSTRRDR